MRPVPHSDDLPVPTPPVNKDLLSSSDEEMPSREDSAESISLEDNWHNCQNSLYLNCSETDY